ncbi:MAG: hypothetical protein WD027_00370 [Gaiellales bacterium]
MPTGRQARRTGLKRGYAFGLELSARVPIPVAAANGRGSGRATTWELVTDVELASTWNAKEAVSLLDRRHLSGRPMLAIDHHEALGYRLAAPGFGRHIVSGDGQTVRSVLPNVAPWRWQRLLFAQVLPLAANLQGLEVLHASAVELDGHAHAFVAPAGTGKTSVAAHLIASGASFVTDDALAVETTDAAALVHSGAGVTSIDRSELRAMTREGRERLGEILGRSDFKVQVAVEPVPQALPLERVFFLERDASAERVEIEEHRSPDPALLLSSTFIWYLRSPQRLLRHLDACARLARTARVFHVRIPASSPARAVASEIEHHIRGDR